MTAHVEHQSNGDVLLSRRYPKAQPGCPTIRLRFTAGVVAGEFDVDAPEPAEGGAK